MFFKFISRWHRDGAGQDLLEYVIVGAFIAMIVLAGATGLGVSVNDWFLALAGVAEEGSTSGGSGPGSGEAGGGAGAGRGGGSGGRGSNCSGQGMASSNGKCNGG